MWRELRSANGDCGAIQVPALMVMSKSGALSAHQEALRPLPVVVVDTLVAGFYRGFGRALVTDAKQAPSELDDVELLLTAEPRYYFRLLIVCPSPQLHMASHSHWRWGRATYSVPRLLAAENPHSLFHNRPNRFPFQE